MNPSFRADIDGLRAIAVLLVVSFHAFPDLLSGGFIGVDVFFVISGYLITGIILADRDAAGFSFSRFYARRVRRIFPSLMIVIAASLAIGWSQLLPATYQSLGRYGVAGALFFPNLLSWSEVGYFDQAAGTKPLLHLWSLGVEEQFYLVWPALLLLFDKLRMRFLLPLALVAAASLAYSCYAASHDPAAAFYAPWSRLWELAIGGILASGGLRLKDREPISFIGLTIIVGSAAMLTKASPFPGVSALLPVSGTALIIAFGSRLLSHKWLVSVGLVSYPLYLWHWPLLTFAAIAGSTSLVAKATMIAASFVLAALTTTLVEKPIRFGRLRPCGVGISVTAMAVVVNLSAIVWRSEGLPQRYPGQIQQVLATMKYDPAANARVWKCWLDMASPFDAYFPECAKGDVLIWGDSHSGRLYAGLARDGIDVAQYTRDSCPPSTRGTDENCTQSNDSVLRKIAEIRPREVVVFAGWARYPGYKDGRLPDDGLQKALTQLRAAAGAVVLIGQLPYWSPALPEQVYDYWHTHGVLPDRLAPDALPYRQIDEALAVAAKGAGVRFVSPFAALCNEEGCLTHTPGSRSELMTWDYGHLTTAGARFLGSLLRLD